MTLNDITPGTHLYYLATTRTDYRTRWIKRFGITEAEAENLWPWNKTVAAKAERRKPQKAQAGGAGGCCGDSPDWGAANILPIAHYAPDVDAPAVLIHFPHGLGDLAMLGYVTPHLDRSRRWFITGTAGDDGTLALFDGHPIVTPLYGGAQVKGGAVAAKPETIEVLRAAGVSHVATGLPEMLGKIPAPWHTKPRARLRLWTKATAQDVAGPLANDLPLDPAPEFARLIEWKLKAAGFGPGRKLLLLARSGVTHKKKDWPTEQAAAFVAGLGREWLTVSLERGISSRVAGTIPAHAVCEGIPFGIAIRALCRVASLTVSVPTGPYCVSTLYPHPTVGIWHDLWPSWYMEPKAAGVNIVGRKALKYLAPEHPGTFIESGAWRYPCFFAEGEKVTAEEVRFAAEAWL